MKKSIILSICFFLFFILQLQQTLRTCEFEVLFRGKNNIPKENIYLKEIMSIGNKEGNENHMFFSPRSVQVNDSGDIFVLDANNYRVQKYDKEGKYVLTIGRKGRGPGELLGCQNMDLDSQGNLVLFDFENSRVSIFSPDGKYIRTIKLGFPPIKGTVDSDNNIYIYYRHNLKLIHKYDPEGNHVTSLLSSMPAMASGSVSSLSGALQNGDGMRPSPISGPWVSSTVEPEEVSVPVGGSR